MIGGLTFGAGLGIGSAMMYLLDPARGKRRRALLRDKVVSVKSKTGEGIETTARDVSNRARGIATTIRSRFTSDEPDDAVLVDRVRSKLGRVVSHPGAVEVAVQDRNVTLGGPILAEEVDDLLSCVKHIRGVNEVTNRLEVHEEAGNHPALQGERKREGFSFEFFQKNWSPTARLVAGVAGASLAVYGGARRDALGAGVGAAGLLLLTRGITNIELTQLARLGDGHKAEARE